METMIAHPFELAECPFSITPCVVCGKPTHLQLQNVNASDCSFVHVCSAECLKSDEMQLFVDYLNRNSV